MQKEAKPGLRQQAIDDLNRCISRVMGGYNAMGSPGRMLEPFKLDKDR